MAETWLAKGSTVTVREIAPRSIAALRLRCPSPGDLSAIAALIGVTLPNPPDFATGDAVRVIWTGPGEWLIIGECPSHAAMEAAATGAVAALCVGIGDGRCIFEVVGADAAELLAKGTSIDLHPGTFAGGASTMFAQINAIVDRPPGLDGFRLIFDVSLRDYLRCWFDDAIVEFR